MMQFIKQYATALWFIGIVLVLYLGYSFFLAPSDEPALTVTNTASSPDADLVALLFELKNIRLDNALFTDPVFRALKDFGQDLVVEPVGRTNPFAPLNGQTTRPAPRP